MLPTAIQFVNQFPRSLEIIVNCARKSEMALWSYFFSIAGDPKLLYQVRKAQPHPCYSYLFFYLLALAGEWVV